MRILAKSSFLTGGRWIGFYLAVLLAWGLLFFMTYGSEQAALARIYGVDYWASLCSVGARDAGFLSVFSMWVLMSGAMMAPTFVPALRVYDDLTRAHATGPAGFWLLLSGYLAVWIGFSALAAGVQVLLGRQGALQNGALVSGIANGGLLVIAGAYQFSRLKNACLTQCREPFAFFMQFWPAGPLRNGLRLGLVCLGCCWALMVLGFVGGVMNLLWMGGATVLMALEKLPFIGDKLTAPLGVVLITSGAGLILWSI